MKKMLGLFFVLFIAIFFIACENPAGSGKKDPDPIPTETLIQERLLTGSSAPSAGIGAEGDLYLDTTSALLYVKRNGSWIMVAELRGPAGSSGSTWHSGTNTPTANLGVDGDFYLDTSNSKIYKKTSGAWQLAVDLGTQAVSNATVWYSDEGAPSDANQAKNAKVGDYYLDTSSALVYVKEANGWKLLLSIAGKDGAQGPAGLNGAAGTVWYFGTGIPSGSLGQNGDFYLDTENSDVYVKTAGLWGNPITNIKGATGATGAPGINGATWFVGSGAPTESAPAGAVIGDFYLNCITSQIFKLTTGGWLAQGTLLAGPSGADLGGGTIALPELPESDVIQIWSCEQEGNSLVQAYLMEPYKPYGFVDLPFPTAFTFSYDDPNPATEAEYVWYINNEQYYLHPDMEEFLQSELGITLEPDQVCLLDYMQPIGGKDIYSMPTCLYVSLLVFDEGLSYSGGPIMIETIKPMAGF